jgi:hypothetical protein
MVREIVEGLALEALGLPVTDMFGDVAETEALSLPVTDMFGDVTDTEDAITDTNGNVTETEMPGLPVTDTNGNATDTAPHEEAPEPRRGGRPWGAMGQRHSPHADLVHIDGVFLRARGEAQRPRVFLRLLLACLLPDPYSCPHERYDPQDQRHAHAVLIHIGVSFSLRAQSCT